MTPRRRARDAAGRADIGHAAHRREVFVSYARGDDEPFVLDLVARLRKRRVDVWWDRAAMESRGRTFLQEIRDAIVGCERLVLVVGPQAAASEYVRAEWQFALEHCTAVVPILRLGEPSGIPREVRGEDYRLVPDELSMFHCPDFRRERPLAVALAELTRILRTPVPPLAPLPGVAALPAHHLPRPQEIAALTRTVLEDTRAPTIITSAQQTTALQGMGGVGKSVLAAAFARSCAARRAFGDGIVWLLVGQRPSLPALGAALARAVGEPAVAATIESSARLDELPRALARRTCLVVLDDVWDVRHVAPFRDALGARCRLLVTSRDAALVADVAGARAHRVDVLDDAEAMVMLPSGRHAYVLRAHGSAVTAIAVDPARPRAITGDADGVAIVWDLENGRAVGAALPQGTPIRAAALAPDGRHAVIGSDAAISIWDLSTAQPVASAALDQAFPDRWHPPLLSLSDDGLRVHFGRPLYAWEPHTGAAPALQGDVGEAGRPLAVSSDGLTVLATPDDHVIAVLDRRTGESRTVPAQPDSIAAVALTADAGRVAVSYYDHQVLIWDLERLPRSAARPARGTVSAVRISPDGLTAALWYNNGPPARWRVADGAEVDEPVPERPPPLFTTAPDGTDGVVSDVAALVARANAGVRLFSRTRRARRAKVIGDHRAGSVLVFGRSTAKVSEAPEPAGAALGNRAYGVELHTRDSASGALKVRRLAGHASPVTSARFTPDGQRVISASIGRLIRVWDAASGDEIAALTGHTGIIRQVLVTADSRCAISASDDRTVRAWDLTSGVEIARFTADAAIVACDLAPDDTLVAADGSGAVHVLTLER